MSMRYQAGIMTASYFPLKVPNRPTGATATMASSTSVSVAFTAPTDVGAGAITGYTVVSSGGETATGASSPVTVAGLTTGTAYTFVVYANNAFGNSPASAPSNSVTPVTQGQQAFTTAGTFSWVAPVGVTSVSVVAVGAGGASGGCSPRVGGAGGSLAYKNNISVTPGNSYVVVVAPSGGGSGTSSYFINTSTVNAPSGGTGSTCLSATPTGDGGGRGGGSVTSCFSQNAGGGAGGYTGNGGAGGAAASGRGNTGSAGSGGGGGGGGGGSSSGGSGPGGGGGVGLLGQGSSGAGGGGGFCNFCAAQGGRGGSGGCNGQPGAFGSPGRGGGLYGGGAGWGSASGAAARGAVRIIWPGTTRQFPSTNTGDL